MSSLLARISSAKKITYTHWTLKIITCYVRNFTKTKKSKNFHEIMGKFFSYDTSLFFIKLYFKQILWNSFVLTRFLYSNKDLKTENISKNIYFFVAGSTS